MRSSIRLIAMAAAALLAAPAAAQTNGFVLHCLSARAAGAGCVTRGAPGQPTSLFRDPAGIASAGNALEVNLSAFTPQIQFRNGANPDWQNGSLHSYPMFSGAYAERLSPRLAWAIGVEPVGGFGSDFRLNHALLGPATPYQSFFAGLKAGPALAWEMLPGLSVGVSSSIVYGQIRQFHMPFTMAPTAAKGLAMLAGMDEHYPALFSGIPELTAYGRADHFAGSAFIGSVGLSWQPSPKLRIAGSWTPQKALNMDGGWATLDLSKQMQAFFGALVQERMTKHEQTQQQAQAYVAAMLAQAGIDPSKAPVGHYGAWTRMTMPQTAGVGATLRAGRWLLGLEGEWMDWSRAAVNMPFTLRGGDNATVNLLVNGDPANGDFDYPFPLNWKDSWSLRAGAERGFASGNALRAGFITGRNPVPAQTVIIAFPAVSRSSLTLGGTLNVGGMPLDVAVVHAFSSSQPGDPNTHLAGREYLGSDTRLSETVVTFGTVLQF
jgi:long-subunit fatty acid transport protein